MQEQEFNIGVLLTRMLVQQRIVTIRGYLGMQEKDSDIMHKYYAERDAARAEVNSIYSQIVHEVSTLIAKQKDMRQDLDAMIKATGRYEDLLAIHAITDHDYEG